MKWFIRCMSHDLIIFSSIITFLGNSLRGFIVILLINCHHMRTAIWFVWCIAEARLGTTAKACTLPSPSSNSSRVTWFYYNQSEDDLSYYAIAFLCACSIYLSIYLSMYIYIYMYVCMYVYNMYLIHQWTLGNLQNRLGHWLFTNFIQYDNSRDAYLKFQNGGSGIHSWSKASRWKQPQWAFHSSYNTLSTFQSLVKPCFLPVYRLTMISIVLPIAAGFTMVRFLREHGQES